jgi:hypothetical protein
MNRESAKIRKREEYEEENDQPLHFALSLCRAFVIQEVARHAMR